jgi:hypothetical protein
MAATVYQWLFEDTVPVLSTNAIVAPMTHLPSTRRR